MDSFTKYITRKIALISFIGSIFIIYPNIVCLPWELYYIQGKMHYIVYSSFFVFRFLYFFGLFIILIRYNLFKINSYSLKKRFFRNFLISAVAYGLFAAIYYAASSYGAHDFWGSILVFQFFVVCSICTLIGHISLLYNKQQEKEIEIERLQIENLQSRCDALTNQINPHFFFNSLGGISSLIRKKDDKKTLQYVDKLSDVFRYILQNDRKGLVTLGEELKFVKAFCYVMEVRFANKLSFSIKVGDNEKERLTLPFLSLLPLIDNVVVHNMIDIDHKMIVSIFLNEQSELAVSNPIFPKSAAPETNGTGLKNLENRFMLLKNQKIRIDNDGKNFTVYLSLK